MNLTSLNQAKDEVFGPVGTPERDRYEEKLAEEIRAHRIGEAIKKRGWPAAEESR